MPNIAPVPAVAPDPAPKAKASARPVKSGPLVSGVLVVISLGIVGFVGFSAYRDMQPAEVAALPTPTPLPSAEPTPVLNTVHQRQGAVVQVNPNEMGHPDPFLP